MATEVSSYLVAAHAVVGQGTEDDPAEVKSAAAKAEDVNDDADDPNSPMGGDTEGTHLWQIRAEESNALRKASLAANAAGHLNVASWLSRLGVPTTRIPNNAPKRLVNVITQRAEEGKDAFQAIAYVTLRTTLYSVFIGLALAIYFEHFYSMLLPTVSQGRLETLIGASPRDAWFGVQRELRRTFFLYDEGQTVSINTLPHWVLYTFLGMPCGLSPWTFSPPLVQSLLGTNRLLFLFFFQERTYIQLFLVCVAVGSAAGWSSRHVKYAVGLAFLLFAFAYVSRQEGVPMLPCMPPPYYPDETVPGEAYVPAVTGVYTGDRYNPYALPETREHGPGVLTGWSGNQPASLGYFFTVLLGVPAGAAVFFGVYRLVLNVKMPNLTSAFTIPVVTTCAVIFFIVCFELGLRVWHADTGATDRSLSIALIPQDLFNVGVPPSIVVLLLIVVYKGGFFQVFFFIGRYLSYEFAAGFRAPVAASFFVLRRMMMSIAVLVQFMLYQVAPPSTVALFVGIFEGFACLKVCYVRDSFDTLYTMMYGKRIATVLSQTDAFMTANVGYDIMAAMTELCCVTKVAALMTSGRAKFATGEVGHGTIWLFSALQCVFITSRMAATLFQKIRFHGVDIPRILSEARKSRYLVFMFLYDAVMSFVDLNPGSSSMFAVTQMCPTVVNSTISGSGGIGESKVDIAWSRCGADGFWGVPASL